MSLFSMRSFSSPLAAGRSRGVRFSARGFTLIELMTVVVVLGILVALAIPTYQNHIRKAKRVECEGVMMNMASTLERRKSGTFTYRLNTTMGMGGHFPGGSDELYCPAETGSAAAGTRSYRVTFMLQPTSTAYSLRADPLGAQIKDKCGALILHHSGHKEATGTMSTKDCW